MTKELTTTQRLNALMEKDKVKEMFANALGDNSNVFVASMIELVANDTLLQQCDPRLIMQECLKAAVLNLPINKDLGFSWVIPYKKQGKQIPQFQLGKNGIVQLALRTGKYKTIHSGTIYEGMTVNQNFLTGEVVISGSPAGDEALGYFAYFELINGFAKSLFWTKERVAAHAKKYSKSYGSQYSPWTTEFNEMAKGTMLKRLIKKYGIMTTSMATAFTSDISEPLSASGQLQMDVSENANTDEIIDIGEDPQEPTVEEEPGRRPAF